MKIDREVSVRAVTRACGWGLFGVSGMTIIGYVAKIDPFYAPWLGRDGMSFASAVCFLLVALAMLYQNYVRSTTKC